MIKKPIQPPPIDAYDQQNTSSESYDDDENETYSADADNHANQYNDDAALNDDEFVLVREDSRRKAGSVKLTKPEFRLSTNLEDITGNIAKIAMTFHNIDAL